MVNKYLKKKKFNEIEINASTRKKELYNFQNV